jgi:hypothetical protein
MQPPDGITCERCGCADLPVVMEAGRAKCSIRDGALCVTIDCPNCGEREQVIGPGEGPDTHDGQL